MEKLILADKTEIEIKAGAGLPEITAVVTDFTALGTLADAITKTDNLKEIQFKSDDMVTGEYSDLKLLTPLFKNVDYDGGKVVATFGLREKTETERRLDALEAGQTIQDGAIRDLGDVVSVIAEGVDDGGEE